MDDERKERPVPGWLRDHDGRSNVRRSQKHERRLSRDLGGRLVPGSGSSAWSKDGSNARGSLGGDFVVEDFAIEHKLTQRASMGVRWEWLKKIEEAAKRRMKYPALIITFETPDGREKADYVLISYDLFRRFADWLKQG